MTGFVRTNLKLLNRVAFPRLQEEHGPAPRVKIILAFAAVLVGNLVHNWLGMALIALLGFIFAFCWRADPGKYAAGLVVPGLIFGLLLPMPALFILPGQPAFDFLGLVITQAGLQSWARTGLRVILSLSWAASLYATTPYHDLVAGLPVPRQIRFLAESSFRYAVLFARHAWSFFLSRLARGLPSGFRDDARFLGSRAGLLFIRAMQTGDRVSMAIISRGGPWYERAQTVSRLQDALWLIFGLFAVFLILVFA